MKKTYLIFFLILFYCGAQAQFEKGTFQVGIGGLPIIYPDDLAETGYSLRANFGYFPIKKLAVGVMPFVGNVEDMKSIGVNIYLRYYITNKRFSLFAEAGTGFGNLQYEDSPSYNGTMYSFNIGPGVHYIFKNKLAIEFLLQYANLRNISYPENTINGNTVIPTLGVQYFIFK